MEGSSLFGPPSTYIRPSPIGGAADSLQQSLWKTGREVRVRCFWSISGVLANPPSLELNDRAIPSLCPLIGGTRTHSSNNRR